MKRIHAIQTDSLDNDASVIKIHTEQYAFAYINKTSMSQPPAPKTNKAGSFGYISNQIMLTIKLQQLSSQVATALKRCSQFCFIELSPLFEQITKGRQLQFVTKSCGHLSILCFRFQQELTSSCEGQKAQWSRSMHGETTECHANK